MGAPTVTVDDQKIFLNTSVVVSDIISYSDPDGDAVTRIRVYDTFEQAGYFTYNGSVQPSHTWIEVDTVDLNKLVYHANSSISQEQLRFSAYANGEWGPANTIWAYSVTANTDRPDVFANDISVVQNEWVDVISFISAYDTQNGWPIDLYKFRNRNTGVYSGYFTVDGVIQGRNEWFYVEADKLDTVRFYAAYAAPNNNVVDIRARDGVPSTEGGLWSFRKTINISTSNNASRPEVDGFMYLTPIDTFTPMRNLFFWTDADGNTIKKYRFWDTSSHSWTGRMYLDGVAQPSKSWVEIESGQLNGLEWLSASRTHNEQVRVQVFDGQHWSKIETIQVRTASKPILGTDKDIVVLDDLERVNIVDLIEKVDLGPIYTKYQVYDSNPDFNQSGKFRRFGQLYSGGTVHEFSAQQFQDVEFQGSVIDNNALDETYVRAFNGSFWSDWQRINFRTEPNMYQLQQSAWFDPSLDPGDPLGISYSFMEAFPEYGSGGEAADDQFIAPWPALKNGFRDMVNDIERYVNIDFEEVPDQTINPDTGQLGGVLRVGTYCAEIPTAAVAYANFPSNSELGGDVWYNRFEGGGFFGPGDGSRGSNIEIPDLFEACTIPAGPYTLDSTYTLSSFQHFVMLHEMGHQLGLKHSFSLPRNAPPAESSQYSVMSYTDDGNGVFEQSFMLYDIAALQRTYGPTYLNSGDTVYNLAYYNGSFADKQRLIWDTGGIDTIDVSHSAFDNVLTVRQGHFNSIDGIMNNFGVAYEYMPLDEDDPYTGLDSTLENIIGGAGNDTITGNESVNELYGGAGNDTIESYGGDDMISGGANDDIFVFKQGHGSDVIDEMRMAGQDRIRMGLYLDMDDFETDFSFSRDGRDLVINLTIDEGLNQKIVRSSITVKDQIWGGSRVEILEVFGQDIDLKYLDSLVTGEDHRFTVTNITGQFGYLVAPA